MQDILEGLDAEQRAVVAHRKGPAIVIAGPGAGKTRTLTTRAAALLQEGVTPEAIMMLTFTRASAKEMVRRAAALDPRAAYMTAGTFHAVGSRIVQANHQILGASKPFTVLDGDDVEQLLRKHIEPVKAGAKNWPRVATIAKIISYAVNTGTTIEEAVRARAPDYEEMAPQIQQVADIHAEAKLENDLVSYDDILLFWAALLEDEEIGGELRRRWSYITIDEGQDTNALQRMVLDGLAGPGGNVVICGDPSQSIYGFRGTSPGVLKAFHDSHPDAVVYPISSNYRSTRNIVAVGAAIDAAMDTGFSRKLVAATDREGPKPIIVDVHDSAAEAVAIADAVLIDKENGGELYDHAVLVRSMTSARRLEAELISRKIPFTVQGGTRIDEAAHIRDLLSVARLAGNLSHEPAWLRLLTRFPKIGDKAAGDMSALLMRSPDVDAATALLLKEGVARRTSFDALVDALTEAARPGLPADRLERVVAAMDPVWRIVWQDDWKNRARDLESVILIAQEHAEMSDFLTALTLDGSIDREGSASGTMPDERPMTISTVHGSKGLEYRNVHIPAFVSGGMPSMFANTPEERDEEMRIAFVAATRAKETLTFYRPRFNGQNQFTSLSAYEPIVSPHVEQRQHQRRTVAGDARVETTKRIDMRSRILGKNKRDG